MEVRVPVRLSAIDRRHYSDAVIVADLSNDATYAEVLHETFGPRVIGLQISRNCDGMNVERRPVKDRSMLFYTVGRSYLLELYHSELQAYQGLNCRWTNDPDALMSSDGTCDRDPREWDRVQLPARAAR